MKYLWKVPASAALIVALMLFLFVALPLFILATLLWMPFAMSGLCDGKEPPVFWLFTVIADALDWWVDL